MDETIPPPTVAASLPQRRSDRLVGWLILLVAISVVGYSAYRATGVRGIEAGVDETGDAGDVKVISDGEPVDLAAHAVKGKFTIFDFYADWCAPCRMLDPQLRKLANVRPDVAIRKIDVLDWSSPVVAQHGIEGLPHMVLFGPDGSLVAAGDAVYGEVQRLLQYELY